jgi:DNA-binding Xre family transcriptional regulator
MNVSVRLKEYLNHHNLSAYKLVQETRGKVAERTVYAFARGEKVKRVDLETLGVVMQALTRLTGKPVTPNDLLEVIEEPEPLEMDEETREWLEMTGTDAMKAIHEAEKDVPPEELAAWLESTQKAAKPAKYVVGKGIVLLEGKA